MLYIDLKYTSLLGPHLRNFKKKGGYLFNFSCPMCGDSSMKANKARGYIFRQQNSLFYKCHNCSCSYSFGGLLKHVNVGLYEQYVLERYTDGVTNKKTYRPDDTHIVAPTPLVPLDLDTLTKISDLDLGHYARNYIEGRLIPKSFHDSIYFTEDFANTVESLFPGRYQNLEKHDPRIVLPFLDQKNRLIGLQGRTLGASKKLRYITAKADPEATLVYGLERLKRTERIMVLEGPIDSLFLPNAIAIAGADLKVAERRIGALTNAVFIFDNEPRNKQVTHLMADVVRQGLDIVIWPSSMKGKDINDMVLTGLSIDDILSIIKKRTFTGLLASLELNNWKKC